MSSRGPLAGRAVVVTRPAGGEDALCARLRELGAEVRELPAIAFCPPADPGPLDAALRGLEAFDWVAFASATAVDRVLGRLAELGQPLSALSSRCLAAVGPATSARLAEGLRPPDLVAAEASGEGLSRVLETRVGGRRVLLPRPAEGRPELLAGLSAAGAAVSAVETYRTLPVPREQLLPLAGWIERGEVDAVAFASPSAVRAVVGVLGVLRPVLGRPLFAAIGPTTAAALREAGLSAGVVAGRPTGGELADAIAAALGQG